MANINQARLKQYLKLNYNVLFRGLHGVGKTAIVKEVFESEGLRWKYFSASTLDPWVDFVGVPKVIDKEVDGVMKSTLQLIRPEFIENDEVDAIFFDELNRAPDKVINAIMELIQFKSINGHKLKNLRVIWAAINPEDDDDTYSVNKLDPAHLDRFHVHIDVPYKVDEEFFKRKYPITGQTFIDWWNDVQMPTEVRKLVSPRRLDYVAHAYENGCRVEDFLPKKTNPKKLRTMLNSISYHTQIQGVKDGDEAKKFLSDVNNASKLLDMVKSSDSVSIDFFMKYFKMMPKELTEPVAEFVHAYRQNKLVVKSVEDFITSLPTDPGNQGTAAVINNTNFEALYVNGGSLKEDLTELNNTKPNLVAKLANQCIDVLTTCKTTVDKGAPANAISAVERILWGMKGKNENRPTTFHEIVKIMSRLNPSLFSASRESINNRLYSAKIVPDMRFV